MEGQGPSHACMCKWTEYSNAAGRIHSSTFIVWIGEPVLLFFLISRLADKKKHLDIFPCLSVFFSQRDLVYGGHQNIHFSDGQEFYG